jgi:polyphosphate kinase
VGDIARLRHKTEIDRRTYFLELFRLQAELVKMQYWMQSVGFKMVIIFEGRDAAGKGGVIKRITQRLNPRTARWSRCRRRRSASARSGTFQRYVPHLPAAGEMVLFDRSWYNRAGVERVMGFASAPQVEEFFRDVPEFERMLVRSGIMVVKYWFSITDQEQQLRFLMRIHDPMKQWKLSPMDLQSRVRWEQYTKAKEEMFERTNIEEAHWYIVEGNDKKKARLNCIHHLVTSNSRPASRHAFPNTCRRESPFPSRGATTFCAGSMPPPRRRWWPRRPSQPNWRGAAFSA